MIPVELFRDRLRAVWRTHTLSEISAATGVGVSTLHAIIHGERDHVHARTAAGLTAGLPPLEDS